ncbi:MAG: hypothetical protein LBG99_02405 [Propionibacteriaceae bacterium]|nr:hypothetical protein [Propionibacteriaceae bacterium]
MSDDLMVLNTEVAPRDPDEFMGWYREQTSWTEDRDYDDILGCAPKLQEWFADARTLRCQHRS